ncbi:hypothetical protein LTR64_000757 [Lithohypha guttulata]|uniref:uncharacterized protein n=1 Tax=Lithohypha guttulata TaxID=1690604 RepID=UPI002DDF0B0B|nr:hypothetical protein LTR51_005474 [Lithohypha guttulata]
MLKTTLERCTYPQRLCFNGTSATQIESVESKSQRQVNQVMTQNQRYDGRPERLTKPPFLTPGSVRTFGNLPFSSAILANHQSALQQKLQLQNFYRPVWQIVPLWKMDESPLGRAYTDFHELAKANPSSTDVSQQSDLIEATLLFRKRRPTDEFNADNWASEFHSTFVDPVTYTLNIAGTYMLARLMRWLLNPTPTTYAALPAMIRPTLRQRMTVHPAFIDIMGIPPVRDALLAKMRDTLDVIMQAGLNVDWPHSVNEALLCSRVTNVQNPDEDVKIFISPQFGIAIDNIRNWVFGRKILTEFPELVTSGIKISEEDTIRPKDRWL